MSLAFKILNGQLKNKIFPLKNGAIIGRSKGDIQLKDKKTSNEHAQIIFRDDSWYLEDLRSANGIFLGAVKVDEVLLSPGEKISIGQTEMLVVDYQAPAAEDHWRAKIKWWITEKARALGPAAQTFSPVQAFEPMIKLTFTQGIQLDQHVLLGYGPRKVGSKVLDIILDDPGSPALAFELQPDLGRARFINHSPEFVKLNNHPKTTEILREGDEIRIGETILRISFEP